MQIRDLFDTAVTERIEPVVKVLDRKPAVLAAELNSLVVTHQWERTLHRALDAYTDAADRVDEEGIGIWISGFFGSGKSLLMKVLGTLLEGGDLNHQRVHDLFLARIPNASPDKDDIKRFLTICERKLTTTAVGGNLHAEIADSMDTLALIAFKLFARANGFSNSWPFAWAVESQIERQGKTATFRARAEELAGVEWEEIVADTSFYTEALYRAASATMPDAFPEVAAVTRAFDSAQREGGITATALVSRLKGWCEARDSAGKRHKLLIQLDELGQWLRSGANSTDRIMQVQALVETAATNGGGRLWLAVTAHGDIQALRENVQQEQYAKINQRFAIKAVLSNDDISQVVEERLLRKRQAERAMLAAAFGQRAGEIADLGSVANAGRVYKAPTAESFALFYPYLPWTVDVLPDVVKGIAQAAHRGDELTGSTRTLIGVVQGALIDTPGLLASPVGRLLPLGDLYEQLATDVPLETRADLNSIATKVENALPLTSRAARALYLLGEAEHIPTTAENVARALVDDMACSLPALRAAVTTELDRLVVAGYAKLVGDQYVFLTTQQRGFQDRVRARQQTLRESTHELIQGLKDYDSEAALRFEDVRVANRDLKLKLAIDTRIVRNPTSAVALQVSSPFQQILDPGIGDDAVISQRANADPNTVYIRLARVPGLADALALAMATAQEADATLSGASAANAEQEVARQAKAHDLPSYHAEVARLLGLAVRGADIFFRGSRYSLIGDGSANAVRDTLAQQTLVPTIYSRFGELPQRITNEEAAVKAALAGNTGNADLQNLGVYKTDGTINEAHALLSTLRGQLPSAEKDEGARQADELRQYIERPPFGWDGNAAKVGLALLLRLSACRLIDSGAYVTDPAGADAVRLLTKDAAFRSVRVQGVRGELELNTLREIRNQLEALFSIKPALVPATLHNELGTALNAFGTRAKAIDDWAGAAQCKLPPAFAAGRDITAELANIGAPVQRLSQFRDQAEAIGHYVTLLDTLEHFRQTHGASFATNRDFYNTMVNANLEIPALKTFIKNWHTVMLEATVTDPARWQEIEASCTAAKQALVEHAAAWRKQAETGIAELEAELPEKARGAKVPDEMLDAEVHALATVLDNARYRLTLAPTDVIAARAALTALQAARLELPRKVQELARKYTPTIDKNVVRIDWHTLLGATHITTTAELDAVVATMRTQIEPVIAQNKIVEIE